MRGTAIQIIRQASAELGLPVPVEAAASKEQQAQQMLALLNACGNELVRAFEWQFLRKTATLHLIDGQTDYILPPDFSKLMNDTLWEQSNVYSVTGPVSGRQWAYLKSSVTLAPNYCFIIKNNTFQFMPAPGDNGQGVGDISYDYFSEGWVQDGSNANVFKAYIEQDNDIPQFDFWLCVKFLKVKTWEAKGLDSSHLTEDFRRLFDSVTSQDHGAPVLGLGRRLLPLPSPVAPETGFGM